MIPLRRRGWNHPAKGRSVLIGAGKQRARWSRPGCLGMEPSLLSLYRQGMPAIQNCFCFRPSVTALLEESPAGFLGEPADAGRALSRFFSPSLRAALRRPKRSLGPSVTIPFAGGW
jgi:hypothetical protein